MAGDYGSAADVAHAVVETDDGDAGDGAGEANGESLDGDDGDLGVQR